VSMWKTGIAYRLCSPPSGGRSESGECSPSPAYPQTLPPTVVVDVMKRTADLSNRPSHDYDRSLISKTAEL
jgi:hypothetical protein